MDRPRLVVAAPHGRSGKTTVTIGTVAALAERGLAVQPFKKGPDYIDPSWLSEAAGRPCRNLDLFMMGEGATLEVFRRGTLGADLSIIEGAMGLYDGVDLEGTGSTAQLARLLSAPILLVVDATRMTRSVAALVTGYQHFEPDVNLAGVVLNNVARTRHEKMLVGAIEHYCGIPVLGCIPRMPQLAIPDRHLGLVPRAEDERLVPAIESARRAMAEYLDLDRLLGIARSAPPLPVGEETGGRGDADAPHLPLGGAGSSQRAGPRGEGLSHHSSLSTHHCGGPKIGVMLDRVFTFYYPENLEALERAGARLEFVDSLADLKLPEVDGLYVGGGFPEMFMGELEANESLREDVRRHIDGGMPVYAECAGLIYLSGGIRWDDRRAEMVGALPCEVEMVAKPQGHGYSVAEVVADSSFFRRGRTLRGHEFHHTRVVCLDRARVRFAYRLLRGSGIDPDHNDGLLVGNVLAAYTHLHAAAAPEWAESFVEAAERQRGRLGVGGRGRG